MDTKHITTAAVLKAGGDEGAIEAVFSTFDVVDRDGDVVLPGAIEDGKSVPMVWAHDWSRPVGRGTICTDKNRAVFDGTFFLDTAAGMDAYRTVKAMGDLQEFSWGFRVLDAAPIERDGATYRGIRATETFEVSPVLVGAGRGTGLLSLKHGQPLATHAEALAEAVDEFEVRVRHHVEHCLKEGRVLSSANRERLASIADALRDASGSLTTILKDTEPTKSADLDVLRFIYDEARRNGVMST